jgi:[ribosomal protein S5]-alanine N-acetyltransferase
MIPALETRRLFLRPIEIRDVDDVQAIFPQWEIVQYLAKQVPWPYPPDGAIKYVRDMALPAIDRGDLWVWTLRLKTDPSHLIGCISLERTETNNRGFWIAPQYQRRGLMTEAVEVVTAYWFEVLKFPVLRVPKAIANTGSRRISEKTGMHVVSTAERDYVCGRLPSEIWEITLEEWRTR